MHSSPSLSPNVPSLVCAAAVGARASILFTKEPYSQDALHGRGAILRCEVKEPEGVEFQWLQDGQPVQDTEQRFKEGSNLQFTAVDRHRDAGAFQCLARNALTGEEARTANASFNIKCEWGPGAAGHAPKPAAAHGARGTALSWEGLRQPFPGWLLVLVWVRQGWGSLGCSSRIPVQLPCPFCPVGPLCLLVSLRLSEMLSPAAFSVCACETGTLLQRVLGTAAPFRAHLIPQRTVAQGRMGSLQCGCLFTPWLEGICISKRAPALAASSGYQRVTNNHHVGSVGLESQPCWYSLIPQGLRQAMWF